MNNSSDSIEYHLGASMLNNTKPVRKPLQKVAPLRKVANQVFPESQTAVKASSNNSKSESFQNSPLIVHKKSKTQIFFKESNPVSRTSTALKSTRKKPSPKKQPQEFKLPVKAINCKLLREVTRTRVLKMLVEESEKPQSLPPSKGLHLRVPSQTKEMSKALKQMKEKERVLRQEKDFSEKVRNLSSKIDKTFYYVEHKVPKRNSPLKKTRRKAKAKSIRVLPSRIIINTNGL